MTARARRVSTVNINQPMSETLSSTESEQLTATHIPDGDVVPDLDPDEKQHQCLFCMRTFNTGTQLAFHRGRHRLLQGLFMFFRRVGDPSISLNSAPGNDVVYPLFDNNVPI